MALRSGTTKGSGKTPQKQGSGKRDLVDAPTGRFFAQRTAQGKFKDLTQAGKSIARDRRTKAKPGHGQ